MRICTGTSIKNGISIRICICIGIRICIGRGISICTDIDTGIGTVNSNDISPFTGNGTGISPATSISTSS
jgi:hypothetical protein